MRREEKLNQFIIDFNGDVSRANSNMTLEQSAFETHKDFTQLLTDAAMKPESSHSSVSTQKFAIALSKDWITNAYNDVIAQNRKKIPNEIEIDIDTFHDKTTDGQNEQELQEKLNSLIDSEKEEALQQCVLSAFERYCLIGGAAIAAIGLLMFLTGSGFLGLVVLVVGGGMVIKHYSAKKSSETRRQSVETAFEEKRTSGNQILLAVLAEIVDFRAEFAEKDGESQKVLDFMEAITPEQYIKKLSDTTRRIRIAE